MAHVLLVVHGVDHRAGAEEQQRLEEGVREEVEDAGRVGAEAEGGEHVAELRARRIGDDALDVVLDEADGGGEERRDDADQRHDLQGRGREFEQRRQARDHEHAGGHHGGGVDEGGDRRRAFHGVRQPGVQQELRRLAHRAEEQQQAQRRQRMDLVAEEAHRRGGLARGGGEDGIEADRALEDDEDPENAEGEAEIADAVDDEGLDGGRVGLGLLIPEADQQIGREPDALPAEEELEEVVGRHQHQHGEGEQRQVGEEARPVRILVHVADRIDVHERGDGVDDDQHDRGQRVDPDRPGDVEVTRRDPPHERDLVGRVADADLPEGDPRQQRREHQERPR